MHQLPVDIQLASSLVIAKIQDIQPNCIICCGMAASRQQLSVEFGASCRESILQTSIDLEQLVAVTTEIQISHDCDQLVCVRVASRSRQRLRSRSVSDRRRRREGLYYSVLNYLYQNQLPARCIFVHVPVLNQENLISILGDFVLLINKLALL